MRNGERHRSAESPVPRELYYENKLREIQKVFCIERGVENVGIVMHHMTRFAIDQVKQGESGEMDPKDSKVPIIIEEGPPLSAKTFTMREVIHPYIQARFERAGVNIKHQHLHWDTIEEDLTDAGIIQPKPREPFAPKELRTVGTFLNLLIAHALRKNNTLPVRDIEEALRKKDIIHADAQETDTDLKEKVLNTFSKLVDKYELGHDPHNPFTFLTVDKPGATGIGDYVIKEYSNNTIPNLLHQKGSFADLTRDRFHLGAIGLIGGSSMDQLLEYREGINTAQTLQEANQIRSTFGFSPFTDEETWRATKGGGSRAQTEKALSQSYELVRALYNNYPEDHLLDAVQGFRKAGILPNYLIDIIKARPNSYDMKAAIDSMDDALNSDIFSYLREDIQRVTSFTSQKNIPLELWKIAFKAGCAAVLAYNIGLYNKNPERQPDIAVVGYTTAPIMQRAA